MSKKKTKKRRAKQINPHKLNETQLKEQIEGNLAKNLINDAYKLVKVLLDRFESTDNASLFQSVLNIKIRHLEGLGRSDDVALLISEAKKRFSSSVFKEADEYVQLSGLTDEKLLEHFSDQSTIPELLSFQIADILYFSKEKNRGFIKKHSQYKDVFYVKEAFKNGYDAVNTPKFLAGLKEASPYKPWFLLHKAIQAFQKGDDITLGLLKKKLAMNSFPAFLVSKLLACHIYLDGNRTESQPLSSEDLEIFKTLCGEHCPVVPMLSKMIKPEKRNSSKRTIDQLKLFEKGYPNLFPEALYFCLETEMSNIKEKQYNASEFFSFTESFNLPDTVAINDLHLFLKLYGMNNLYLDNAEDYIEKIIDSKEIRQNPFFNTNSLKAELVFGLAIQLQKDHQETGSPFGWMGMDEFEDDEQDPTKVLEKALRLSAHNPKIFTELINGYIESDEKASVLNPVIEQFLNTFSTHPAGYELAGKNSFRNHSFQKAIGFYKKAKELMPLNKDFAHKILDCYEGIIAKRGPKNFHLIDKDIEQAFTHVDEFNAGIMNRYRLLSFKAKVKKATFIPIDQKQIRSEANALYELIATDRKSVLKLIHFITHDGFKMSEQDNIISEIGDKIKAQLDFKTYMFFFKYGIDDNNFTNSRYQEFVSSLTLRFLEQEKSKKTLTVDEYYKMLLLALTEGWNRSFIGFVYLANTCFSENKVFQMFKQFYSIKPNHGKILKLLMTPEVSKWCFSSVGKKTMDELSTINGVFEELCYLVEDSDQRNLETLRYDIEIIIEENYDDIDEFSLYLDQDCVSEDKISLLAIKKLFGNSVRTRPVKRKSKPNHGAIFDLGRQEMQRRLKDLEKLEQEARKKRQEEQAEQKKLKEETAKKEQKVQKEIEENNEQLSFLDILNSGEAL